MLNMFQSDWANWHSQQPFMRGSIASISLIFGILIFNFRDFNKRVMFLLWLKFAVFWLLRRSPQWFGYGLLRSVCSGLFHFFYAIFCCFLIELRHFPYLQDKNFLLIMWSGNIFAHSLPWLFALLRVLNSNWSNLLCFSFMTKAFSILYEIC